MPARRYQTPSLVRHTSSASTLPPVVNRITRLLRVLDSVPWVPVETGPVLVRKCAVAACELTEADFATVSIVGSGAGDSATAGDRVGAGPSTTSGLARLESVCCEIV